jgi:hypothetical protein
MRKTLAANARLPPMKTLATSKSLPFEFGEPRSFAVLTILPLYPQCSSVEYVGLDEAVANGLQIHEVDEHGVVEALHVINTLDELVLLYEGEELIGAKQNRILEWTVLADANSKLTVPVNCVERGRWAHRSPRFAPAAHAAAPELRRHKRQAEVWAEVSAKSARLGIASPTDAQADLYTARARSLDEYVEALPRLSGQSGALVAVAGEPVCLDFVSRPDVFAGLNRKLLRGYALQAVERPAERKLRRSAVDRFLAAIDRSSAQMAQMPGPGSTLRYGGAVRGSELSAFCELVALTVYPGEAP